MKINLSSDGEMVEITIDRESYHLIWSSLHAVKNFIGNQDFMAISGYSTDDAINLCDALGDAFDEALKR